MNLTQTIPSLDTLRRTLEEGIEEGLHLGGQAYVSRRDPAASADTPRQVWELAIGERAHGDAMTTDTLMLWLSASKPVAAVALALLWQRGQVDLDDTVAQHVPEFAERGKDRITLRHVLTHTGGFRLLNVGWPEASWEEIIATICASRPEPRWEPGKKAGYHMASSWFILGEVIRRVDGRHYSRFVREEIFLPLGMDECYVGMPQEDYDRLLPRLVRMYGTDRDDEPLPRTWHKPNHVVGCSPGGNGYGPISQLGLFYEMLLDRGRGPGGLLLTPQTVEALTTPHRVGLRDQTFKHKLDWGLGFIVNSEHYGAEMPPYGYGRHASRRTFGHSGFQSSVGFADPVHGLCVTLAVNGNPGEPRHTERFRRLTEAVYEDLDLVPSNP